MTDKKTVKKKKHVSYPQQREQCRLNKFTYEEKIGTQRYLMCNYPFPQPVHKKGLCKASLCTDMREIPDDILAADDKEAEPVGPKGEAGDDLSDEVMDEAANINSECETFDEGAEAITKAMGADGPDGSMVPSPDAGD
jgi:hypothetical protein